MKKLLALLLALSMAVSLFAVTATATETDGNPEILSAVAINNKQITITISEEVKVTGDYFSLYLYTGNTGAELLNNTDKDGRYAGTLADHAEYASTFTWTISTGYISDVYAKAKENGYKVYLGVHGENYTPVVNPTRAQDKDGNGFIWNCNIGSSSHKAQAIEVTPYAAPVITNAYATDDATFVFTTNVPIKVQNASTFALFIEKNGIVEGLTGGTDRFGGTVTWAEGVEYATSFTWTITEKDHPSATAVITEAISNGYKVYLGLNGETDGTNNGVISTTKRATTEDGKGFLPNVNLNRTDRGIHGIEVEAYTPFAIQSVKTTSNTHLVIEFNRPLASYDSTKANVVLGVSDASGNTFYTNESEDLSKIAQMTAEWVEGKLICYFGEGQSKQGMEDADAKNLAKIITAINEAYPDQHAAIGIFEPTAGDVNDTGYVEAAKDANGIALKGTAKRGTANRDLCVSELVLDVYGEAQVGENTYFTLADAMEAANDDDTIVLLDDVTVTDVAFILKSGVALDLNGNTLTVNNFLLTFDDVLQVIDSQNGVGKLVITKKNVCANFADNNYLPLYDNGGYRFFVYEFCHLEEETDSADTVRYWVGLDFTNKAAYNLLTSEDNADVDFGVNMTITKSDGFDEGLNWIFSDALMDEFVQKNVNGSKRMAVILTISGMTRLGDAQYTTKAILRSSVVDLARNMDMMAQ